MRALTQHLTCGHCAGDLDPVTTSAPHPARQSIVARCTECGYQWLIRIEMALVEYRSGTGKTEQLAAARTRQAELRAQRAGAQ